MRNIVFGTLAGLAGVDEYSFVEIDFWVTTSGARHGRGGLVAK